MKRLLPVALLLAGLAVVTSATAALAQEGVKLAWDQCQNNPASTLDKTFACDVNTGVGPFVIVASFTAPDSITQFVATQAGLDLIAASASLPDWWRMRNQTGQTGQCRNGAMGISGDFTSGYSGCSDAYGGQASGGFSTYLVGRGKGELNTVFLKTTLAIPGSFASALNPGEEYYSFRASINVTKSVGLGSCAGCSTPVCIYLNWIAVQQSAGTPGGNVTISNAIGPAARSITWQGGSGADCNLVPTKNHTWGQIKALYR